MSSPPPIYYVEFSITVLAVIATLFFWISSLALKTSKNTIFMFFINLSLMTVLQSISFCLNWVIKTKQGNSSLLFSDSLCTAQSVINLFTNQSSELWISVLLFRFHYEILTMTKAIDSGEYDEQLLLENYETVVPKISLCALISSYCISYGVPLVFIIILRLLNILGIGSVICWIDSKEKYGETWKSIDSLIRVVTIIFIVVYSVLIIKIQKVKKNQNNHCCSLKGKNIKILLIPLIQSFISFPSLIYRIIHHFHKRSNTSNTSSIVAYFDPSFRNLVGIIYPLFFAYLCGIYQILFSKIKKNEFDKSFNSELSSKP